MKGSCYSIPSYINFNVTSIEINSEVHLGSGGGLFKVNLYCLYWKQSNRFSL